MEKFRTPIYKFQGRCLTGITKLLCTCGKKCATYFRLWLNSKHDPVLKQYAEVEVHSMIFHRVKRN